MQAFGCSHLPIVPALRNGMHAVAHGIEVKLWRARPNAFAQTDCFR